MSKKKVETPKNGQATNAQVYKLPNGKLVTKEQRDKIREEQEEMYKTRRINAFTRRCKRMGISEEDTAKYVEKLVAQLEAPHQYAIHVLFDTKIIYDRVREVDEKTGEEKWKTKQKQASNLAKEAILNSKIECKILTNNWAYIIGDDAVLAKLREIMPGYATVNPHVLKAEPILPVKAEHTPKKPSNNSKDVASKAKSARKANKIAHFKDRKNHHRGKSWAKAKKHLSLLEKKKSRKAKVIQVNAKKGSKGSKKASTALKQAA